MFKTFKTLIKSPITYKFSTKPFQKVLPKSLLQKRLTLTTFLASLTYYTYTSHSTKNDTEDFFESTLPADFQEGEKREVQLGPKEDDCVLVCKVQGKYYCVSNKCPHFGAPLGKGPLFDDKIFCPWHNAAFSVKDGAPESGPILNGLETFHIEEKNGQLSIKVPKSKLNAPKVLPMVTRDPENNTEYVIIGGGPAGISAAETLRQGGFSGKITILSKEEYLPYDRTILSKAVFFANAEKLVFRQKEFLEKYNIDIKTGHEVEKVDFENRKITTQNKQEIIYDKLLIASGTNARHINIQGASKDKIFTLREYQDIEKLKKKLQESQNIVIVGASFIGLESASSIKDFLKDKINVNVVDNCKVPHERVFGDEIGQVIQKMHEQNGIKFHLKTGIQKMEDNKIYLNDGSVLEADLVLLGAGVSPNTAFAQNIDKDFLGGIKTDVFLESSQKGVFAAGDIANYPYHFTGQRVRIEHINTSIYQGYVAALNMLGKQVPVQEIPFFWTRQWNKSIHYTGYGQGFDDVFIQGDLNKLEFMAWYSIRGRVVAFAAMNKGPVAMVVNEAMKQNVLPSMQDIKEGKVNIEDIKKSVEKRGSFCKCQRMDKCCGVKAKI